MAEACINVIPVVMARRLAAASGSPVCLLSPAEPIVCKGISCSSFSFWKVSEHHKNSEREQLFAPEQPRHVGLWMVLRLAVTAGLGALWGLVFCALQTVEVP